MNVPLVESLDTPSVENGISKKGEFFNSMIISVDTRLNRLAPGIEELLIKKHSLLGDDAFKDTHFDRTLPIADQIYDQPTYNGVSAYDDLNTRARGTIPFQESKETYDKQRAYTDLILKTAQEQGFVTKTIELATEPIDQKLEILDSQLVPIERPVEAVIVPAAAGLTTITRLRDAVRNIESGAIKTSKLIITTCERPVEEREINLLEDKGFHAGTTEFEFSLSAVRDLLNKDFADTVADLDISYGTGTLSGKIAGGTVLINGKPVDVEIVSAPINPTRVMYDGTLPKRANTEETFRAVEQFLSSEPGLLVIESHDVWAPWQGVIAENIFGIDLQKDIIATGPMKSARVTETKDENGETIIGIWQPESVIDEMAKTYKDLTVLREFAVNGLTLLLEPGEKVLTHSLLEVVPNMNTLRANKAIYRELPIDTQNPKFNEKLVPISSYGIPGQSYYSRSNATTGEKVPGVPTEAYLRLSVAERLYDINQRLLDPAITAFFGAPVELYVEEGVRTIGMQTELFDTLIPALLRTNHPGITDEEMNERKKDIIAKPSLDPKSPSPHATGGAVDVILRYKQDVATPLLHVSDVMKVPMGHHDGDTSEKSAPDYFEIHEPTTEDEELFQRNRRAFYAIMTGEAFGIETGFSVNPTELWHWSMGDQLNAFVTGNTAYYSFAPEVE
jgi:D-alanyl-D-alanine dipeptidase